ncbi:MAG TPA: hypothetical protein VHL53_04375, partial [Acidimicrobiia bacterium]|nr:hypothetical protein [Acidimicrobiia bacterium]
MIGSRKAVITASLVGALLIAGAPTFAFGEGDSAHQAKANSVTVQKAKDSDDKKADDKKDDAKKDADKKASSAKKDNAKKADDQKKAAD